MSRHNRWVPCLVITVVMITACGSGDVGAPSTTTTIDTTSTISPVTTTTAVVATTAPPVFEVKTTIDVRFAEASPPEVAWTEPLLDVYAPVGAERSPLVVLLPAHQLAKSSTLYSSLAKEIARRGGVVMVPNWSQLDELPGLDDEMEIVRDGISMAGCAISFAVTHAVEYGADPDRLVLVGHLYGGAAAVMADLAGFEPIDGCLASANWTAVGLVTIDTDLMLALPDWNVYGADSARVAAALTAWSVLDDAEPVDVVLAYSVTVDEMVTECGLSGPPEWVGWRDPTGAMLARLAELDAFDDGCLSNVDMTGATADELIAHGFHVDLLQLPGPNTTLLRMDPPDLAAVADAAIALAAR